VKPPQKPSDLGFPEFEEFRPGQAEIIAEIVNIFQSGKRIIILEAPTGSGKSLIAMSVIAALNQRAVITTQTKQLASQYHDAHPTTTVIQGRENYQCALQPELPCAIGPCIAASFECASKKSICPYYLAKQDALKSPCAIMNIWYFMYEANYVGGFSNRDLLVIDEGHLLESALMSFISIELSKRQLTLLGCELPSLQTTQQVSMWAENVMPKLQSMLADAIYEDNPRRYRNLQTQNKRVQSIASTDLSKWILTKTYHGYTLKPVWVTTYGNPAIFQHASKILIMSATIRDAKQYCKCLGIPQSSLHYMEAPSHFPKEHRPINFWPVAKIGYKSTPRDYSKLVKAIDTILELHRGDKGILHTVSYKLLKKIVAASRHNGRILTHDYKNREEVIRRFKESKRNPVLASPSIGIGLDLPDDESRFCIIAKVPWQDMSDEQVKKRVNDDRGWYSWNTACAMIQMSGRCIRSDTDYATTYLLDGHAGWFMQRNARLFPIWWRESVYHVEKPSQFVLPRTVMQPKLAW